MDVDERSCPNCGHSVLNWDCVCPGCNQVPWNTPAGQKIIAQRRRRSWWLDHAFILVLLVLVGVATACGVVSAIRSPGSVFCPLPGSDKNTQALLAEIDALGSQLEQSDLAAEQQEAARFRLAELTKHSDRIIRQSAGRVLIGAEVDALEAQLKQPDIGPDQRQAAQLRLWELFEQKEDEYGIRWKVASALADVGDRRIIPWLIDQLDNGKTNALLAKLPLWKLTGEGLDWDRATWKRWWKAHKDDPAG